VGLLKQKHLELLQMTRFTTPRGVAQHVREVTRKIDKRREREGPRIPTLAMAAEIFIKAVSA
jgi:glycyl-tRNA synthetase beta subunit